MPNEERIVGSHYIFNFYNDMVSLRNYYAQLAVYKKELKFKYGEEPEPKSMSEDEKKILSSLLQTVRLLTIELKVQIEALLKILKLGTLDPGTLQAYNNIVDNPIILNADIELFLKNAMDLLGNKVIQNLLRTADQVLNDASNVKQTKNS